MSTRFLFVFVAFLFFAPLLARAEVIFLTTTGANTWTVPSDWNSSNNTIEVIGGGGGGVNNSASSNGNGGGGGAYSAISNLSLSGGASVDYSVGTAGAADGGTGGDTWFNGTTLGGSSVGAKGGSGATTGAAGAGGVAASGVGATKYSGGTGGSGLNGGGGGGGAAGSHGNGAQGGTAAPTGNRGAGGGGGADGGSAGVDGSGDTSGAGGNNRLGAGGGTVANPGNAGTSGGGGGASNLANPGNGSNNAGGAGGAGEVLWTQTSNSATAGPGGGGGGGGYGYTGTGGTGGTGGLYGGGGAGGGYASGQGSGAAGAQGIIVITYSPLTAPTVTTGTASGITTTGATLNGSISSTGGVDATQSGFAYGTAANLSTVIATSTLGAQTGTASFNNSVSSLSPNTTYYVRAYATNSMGTGYGSIQSFTTTPQSHSTLSKPPNNLGLVGYWSFDEGSGSVATDFSGRGNAGTFAGNATWAAGKRGKAASFDGSGDYVSKTSPSSFNTGASARTIMGWIKPVDTTALKVPFVYGICNAGNDSKAFGVYLDASEVLNFWGCGGAYDFSTGVTIRNGEWTHIAVTYDGTNVRVYVNGTLAGSPTARTLGSSTAFWEVGGANLLDSGNYYFNGQIDDVRIYTRALAQSEIQRFMSSGTLKLGVSSVALQQGSSLASGLVGHWTFDGPDVTSVIADRSGQGNNGGFFGGATSSAKTIGKLGQAIRFDGVDDYFLSTIPAMSEYTYAMWVRPARQTSGAELFQLFTDSVDGATLYVYQNHFGAWNGSELAGSTTIQPDTWYHVVVTDGPSAYTLYVNGVEEDTSASTGAATGGNALIGIYAFSFTRLLPGIVDDARVYNRALTAAEVKQLYNLGRATIVQ